MAILFWPMIAFMGVRISWLIWSNNANENANGTHIALKYLDTQKQLFPLKAKKKPSISKIDGLARKEGFEPSRVV